MTALRWYRPNLWLKDYIQGQWVARTAYNALVCSVAAHTVAAWHGNWLSCPLLIWSVVTIVFASALPSLWPDIIQEDLALQLVETTHIDPIHKAFSWNLHIKICCRVCVCERVCVSVCMLPAVLPVGACHVILPKNTGVTPTTTCQ